MTDLRNRPVVSYWKEPKRRRSHVPKRDPITRALPCPECKIIGEVWQECGLCGGEGVVNSETLAAWQEARVAS